MLASLAVSPSTVGWCMRPVVVGVGVGVDILIGVDVGVDVGDGVVVDVVVGGAVVVRAIALATLGRLGACLCLTELVPLFLLGLLCLWAPPCCLGEFNAEVAQHPLLPTLRSPSRLPHSGATGSRKAAVADRGCRVRSAVGREHGDVDVEAISALLGNKVHAAGAIGREGTFEVDHVVAAGEELLQATYLPHNHPDHTHPPVKQPVNNNSPSRTPSPWC